MNFEMQDLVGSWAFIEYGQQNCIGLITSIDMRGGGVLGSKVWKPRYPIKINLLINVMGGTRWHHPMGKQIYLDEVNIITPEVAEIYMQANNLTPPERKRNEQL